ncbi:MAG: glycosyltransferase family 2 protein, partial [Myxococcota bacterium]
MTTPEISVLMPVRDALATVERAARSILDQSVGSLELIAIDDRSVDGSGCFLKRLAEQDSRLRVVSNPGNGLIDALNHGLSVARGPFIARMDAD